MAVAPISSAFANQAFDPLAEVQEESEPKSMDYITRYLSQAELYTIALIAKKYKPGNGLPDVKDFSSDPVLKKAMFELLETIFKSDPEFRAKIEEALNLKIILDDKDDGFVQVNIDRAELERQEKEAREGRIIDLNPHGGWASWSEKQLITDKAMRDQFEAQTGLKIIFDDQQKAEMLTGQYDGKIRVVDAKFYVPSEWTLDGSGEIKIPGLQNVEWSSIEAVLNDPNIDIALKVQAYMIKSVKEIDEETEILVARRTGTKNTNTNVKNILKGMAEDAAVDITKAAGDDLGGFSGAVLSGAADVYARAREAERIAKNAQAKTQKELDMLRLNTLSSERQRIVQLASQLQQSFEQSRQTIARNVARV